LGWEFGRVTRRQQAWGRGIEKINNECKMADVPAPEINYEFAGLMITFQARIGEKVGETGKISPETTPKTREKILKLILEDTSISIKVGQIERLTQNRIVKLFTQELDYTYLGNWEDRPGNSNIEEELLTNYLTKKGYSPAHITKALHELQITANNNAGPIPSR